MISIPEGVASGDPDPHSVILWTRRPFAQGTRQLLTVEVAEDEAFRRVIAHAQAPVSSAADWTARVLIGGLKPARTYWYRFTDTDGNGSRVGRTITAPLPNDPRPVNFAFVSCQDVNEGKLNAYRRMIYEDERAPAAEQLGFVLHLGDFIYEVVQYPDEVKTRYDRTIYEVARIPDGHKVGNFHIPLTVDGYRAIYKGYLADPDLQDARARWPFVAIWDNHEFSWQGWQSIVKAGRFEQPGQTVKVAANQAWFEYLPSRRSAERLARALRSTRRQERRRSTEFDEQWAGRGTEQPDGDQQPQRYRALRYGRHLDLIITDQHSYRSADPFSDRPGEDLGREFNGMFPEDADRCSTAGAPSTAAIRLRKSGSKDAHSPTRKDAPPQPFSAPSRRHGSRTSSSARRRRGRSGGIPWARSTARADPQNLPAGPRRSPGRRTYTRLRRRRLRQRVRRARRDLRPRSATRRSPASPSSPATATASGPATPPRPSARQVRAGRLSLLPGPRRAPGGGRAREHRPPRPPPPAPLIWRAGGGGKKPKRR